MGHWQDACLYELKKKGGTIYLFDEEFKQKSSICYSYFFDILVKIDTRHTIKTLWREKFKYQINTFENVYIYIL